MQHTGYKTHFSMCSKADAVGQPQMSPQYPTAPSTCRSQLVQLSTASRAELWPAIACRTTAQARDNAYSAARNNKPHTHCRITAARLPQVHPTACSPSHTLRLEQQQSSCSAPGNRGLCGGRLAALTLKPALMHPNHGHAAHCQAICSAKLTANMYRE